MSYRSKILDKVKISPDQEIHIKRVVAEGEVFCSIREHVPSTGIDGRGITIPERSYRDFLESVTDMAKFFGVDDGDRSPGPGQGSLFGEGVG